MTETKTREFTPITTQEAFDEAIKGRLAREREKWEKGTDDADLRAQLEAKDEEIADLKKGHYLEATRRAFAAELNNRGVVDEGRRERVMRHVNLDEVEATRRAFAAELNNRGVVDEGRRERVMRHVNLDEVEATADGKPSREHVLRQLDDVSRDLSELLQPRGGGSRGSKKPVLETEKPLTRQEVEAMSPTEQARPGMRERIDRFLTGERG